MAHPYLKARTKQKWIESAKHLRIPPSPTVWACGFSRGSVKTIFMPLTFIAGIYGMNFAHMPELTTRYGYFVTLGAMALLALGMILFFKKNRWFDE